MYFVVGLLFVLSLSLSLSLSISVSLSYRTCAASLSNVRLLPNEMTRFCFQVCTWRPKQLPKIYAPANMPASEMSGLQSPKDSWGFQNQSRKLTVQDSLGMIWEFPKVRGTFMGVPRIRIIIFRGLYLGPPY